MPGWPSPAHEAGSKGYDHPIAACRWATNLSLIFWGVLGFFFGRQLRAWGASAHPGKPAPSRGGARSESRKQEKNHPKPNPKKQLLCLPGQAQQSTTRSRLPSPVPCQKSRGKGLPHAPAWHGSLSQRSHLRKAPLFVNTPGKGTIIPCNSIPAFLHPPTHPPTGFAAQKAANNPPGRELRRNRGPHAMSKALITTVILEA